jgi:hypothetical protein
LMFKIEKKFVPKSCNFFLQEYRKLKDKSEKNLD